MIMMHGLLPCWNMNVMRKWTFCVFVGHEQQTLILGILIFMISIKFCCCEFLVNIYTKGLLLTSTTPRQQILMAEIIVLLDLDIRLPASSRIVVGNRFVYDGWITFWQYYADVFFSKASPLRTSASLRKHSGRQCIHAMSNGYSKFNLL